MLQDKETQKKFGYLPTDLTQQSSKKVVVECDYCHNIYTAIKKNLINSRKSLNKDACIKCKFKKREDVSMAKFGVKNSAQRPEVRKNIGLANSDRLRSDKFKEQVKKTNLEKYGVEYTMQNRDIRQKYEKTMMGKYGVINPINHKEFQDKAKTTCLEKYGTEHYTQSDEGKQRIKDGMRKIFGVDNCFQSEIIKQQIKETNLKNYGVDHHMKLPEKAALVQKKGLKTKIDNNIIRTFHGKTIPELAKITGYSRSRFSVLSKKYGIEEALKMTPKISCLEQVIQAWLTKVGFEFIINARIENKRPDIIIDNIILELDGLYWHSDAIITNDSYHVDRRNIYIKNGYKPLFFRENEIVNKLPIVKSIILNKLGKSKIVYARKCKISKVNKQDAKIFMDENHLMGKGRGDTYGLYYEDKLVSAITILNKVGELYEISRFCNQINMGVTGGFSRLLKFVENVVPMKSLITFIDLRYGEGSYLQDFGFIKQNSYLSFKWTNGTEVFGRMKFPGATGYKNGLCKIWDCGQLKYVKNYS